MTTSLQQLQAKWETRRAEALSLSATVSLAAVSLDILTDLAALADSHTDVVTLQEAHAIGGYSIDHLQRLVSQTTLPNVGRKGAPRIPRSAVPIKAGHTSGSLPLSAGDDQVSARRRIVADAQARKGA